MKVIKASEFKAKCLKLMDEVEKTGEPLIITKHGRPVAKLMPAGKEPAKDLFGRHAGQIEILGDIVASTGEIWDAQR